MVSPMAATLAQKLQIRPGRTVALLRAPDRHRPLLGAIAETKPGADVVLLYSRSRAQLERDAGIAMAALHEGGVLWICYPKLSAKTPSDMSREACRDAMAGHGWSPVTQIAIDDTWSALRFRPSGDVGRRSNLPPK
jgi:hypothetical protein